MKTESFISKAGLVQLYGTNYHSFSLAIEPIKEQIGWKEGKQLFSPKIVRIIFDYLGEPLTREELIIK